MNDLFLLAAQNTIVVLVLTVLVYALTRVWRHPPVAHVLWLVVLLKLVAPPVMRVDWPALPLPAPTQVPEQIAADASRTEIQQAESVSLDDLAAIPTTSRPSALSVKEDDNAAGLRQFWIRARPVLFAIWLGGAALCTLIVTARIVRFNRLLRETLPAPERLQQVVADVASRLGVRSVPDMRYVETVDVPFLWCVGPRSTIVLPRRLFRELDDRSCAMILAHELAHLRRRDHWVRGVELLVSIVYWWNPLIWVIRREIHQAEDLCCDAWVRWAFPDSTKDYAQVLLYAAESLGASPLAARLLPASPFLRSLSLKERIEMILESRFAPRVSTKSKGAIVLLALLALPSFHGSKKQVLAAPNDEPRTTPAARPDAATTSEFPYAVKFEQGATQFLDGDKVTILEVRGTADTFKPGEIYLIKGKYTLGSHEKAVLAAYTTAMDAANATGLSYKAQTTLVDRGDGTFTLFFPMACRGWPHVSFYGEGQSFGGNYFGTGDFVLKQMWGTKKENRDPAAVYRLRQ
jgi:bla regulator protein blaR1